MTHITPGTITFLFGIGYLVMARFESNPERKKWRMREAYLSFAISLILFWIFGKK